MPSEPNFADAGIIELYDQSLEDRLFKWLEANHARVIRLDGSNVTDEKSFFRAVTFETEPIHVTNWNSFIDQFRGELEIIDAEEVALVWTHVDHILDHGLGAFIHAIDTMMTIAREVPARKDAYQHLRDFHCFLLGEGPNFN